MSERTITVDYPDHRFHVFWLPGTFILSVQLIPILLSSAFSCDEFSNIDDKKQTPYYLENLLTITVNSVQKCPTLVEQRPICRQLPTTVEIIIFALF